MISDEEDLPETRPGSVVGDDELPETDPEEEGNSSKGANSPVKEKKKTVADEDYDSFDDFDDFEPTQLQAKSSSSSEDSEAGDDSEYVHEPETQETQLPQRTYSLRGQKKDEVVDLPETDPEDEEDNSFGDQEYNHEEEAPNTSLAYIRSVTGWESEEDEDYAEYRDPDGPKPYSVLLQEKREAAAAAMKKSGDSSRSLDDSFDDKEFVDSVLETKKSIKRKRTDLDDGEFFTGPQVVQVDKETRKKWAAMTQPPPEALAALDKYFGHKAFRPKQWDVVRSVLAGRDQFVLMSTGYGKSVCYQLPSLLLNSLTVVISPLISLMNDQVTTLVSKGIQAIKLDGDSMLKDWDRVKNNMNRIRFVYMSPEMATSSRGLDLLALGSEYLTLLAIDEAHCVSQWGHDFRNSYRHLASVRNRSELCAIPMIALTATATVRVRDDVIQNLKLRSPLITSTSFDRKNLYISVHSAKNITADLKDLLKMDPKKGSHFDGPTIIYCQTKQMVENVNDALREMGVRSAHYHAGMTKNQREKSHTDFIKDKITTIVATVAFGMGIDKPDVRQVIHYGCPKDIESYYQEMGRAGRDGAPSVCRVFWAPKDMNTNKFKLRNAQMREEVVDNLNLMLKQLELVLTTVGCRRYQLLKHFDPTIVKPPAPQADCCDRCTEMISNNQDSSSSLMDVATEARILFQVILDMYDGKTGMGKPIDFVRGSSKEEWRVKTMQQKKLFGSGKMLPEKWWKELGSALRMAGYITEVRLIGVKFGNCVSLAPTAKTWLETGKELRIEATPILLQGKKEKNAGTSSGSTRNTGAPSTDVVKILGATKKQEYKWANEDAQLMKVKADNGLASSEKTQELRKRLDEQRMRMATLHDIAPFQVASNTVLEAFTERRPTSVENLALIDGMDANQKRNYAKQFMEIVIQYAKETKISTNVNSNETIPANITAVMDSQLTDSIKRVYKAHLIMRSDAKAIATTCGLAESTVFSYLATAIEKGLPVHLDKLNITKKMVAIALKAARDQLGSNINRLAPWKEVLGELVDYNQLRIIKAVLLYEYGVDSDAENSGSALPTTTKSTPKPAVNTRPMHSQEPAKKRFKL